MSNYNCREFCKWVVSLDDLNSPDRPTVTLTEIINRASSALNADKQREYESGVGRWLDSKD